MSSHESHDHPNTPAARAKCRRANSTERVVRASGTTTKRVIKATPITKTSPVVMNVQVEEFDPTISHITYIPASEPHCELCGTFDIESLETGDQGYTACCNEPVCYATPAETWMWEDLAYKTKGTIQTCCSARVSMPHDQVVLRGRV